MSLAATFALGLIAGATILLGMPIGRLKNPAPRLRVVLNAVSVGILLFLFWDVLKEAWEPVDEAFGELKDKPAAGLEVAGFGALFVGGLAVGLLGLVFYERWMGKRATGVGLSPLQLATMIAVGIGLHNFAEGLAIGQSAASGKIGLAVMLVIGFALHNGTEGFGVTAPLAGDVDESGARRIPSWGRLLLLALIAGGPTFLGTIIGHWFASEVVSVLFMTLAAGSIVNVVLQLVMVAAKSRRMDLLAYGVLIGLVAGFATDGIIAAAGA